jgi:hypothetical protein
MINLLFKKADPRGFHMCIGPVDWLDLKNDHGKIKHGDRDMVRLVLET